MPDLGMYLIWLNHLWALICSNFNLFFGAVTKIFEIRSWASKEIYKGRLYVPETIFLKSLEVSGSQNGR